MNTQARQAIVTEVRVTVYDIVANLNNAASTDLKEQLVISDEVRLITMYLNHARSILGTGGLAANVTTYQSFLTEASANIEAAHNRAQKWLAKQPFGAVHADAIHKLLGAVQSFAAQCEAEEGLDVPQVPELRALLGWIQQKEEEFVTAHAACHNDAAAATVYLAACGLISDAKAQAERHIDALLCEQIFNDNEEG